MRDNNIKVLITGIPNYCKSAIVSELSGVTIRTANYPGTTVSINRAEYGTNGIKISIIDLPRTSYLGGDRNGSIYSRIYHVEVGISQA